MLAINPKIKQKAEDIRKKIFGSEVRESLASGIEAISEDVEATIGRQGYVEEQFQDVLDETTGKDVISAPELIAARNGKSNLKTRLDEEHAEVTAQLAQKVNQDDLNYYWVPPVQPPARQDHEGWFTDAYNWKSDQYINNNFEPLRLAHSDYITRVNLGKDQSGEYDVWRYAFTPKNYKKTIVIQTGLHGGEITPVVTMMRFFHYLCNEWEKYPALAEIRENVRIIYIPFVNPWGMNQFPRKRYNSRGVDLNRNFHFEWDEFVGGEPFSHDYKGSAPASEIETQYVINTLNEFDGITTFLDLHNTGTPSWDFYVPIPKGYAYNDMYKQLFAYFGRDIPNPSISNTESNGPIAPNHAYNILGIPSSGAEWNDTRFGGEVYSSQDLTKALEWFANVIIAHCREFDLDKPIFKEEYYTFSGKAINVDSTSNVEIPELKSSIRVPTSGIVKFDGFIIALPGQANGVMTIVPMLGAGTAYNVIRGTEWDSYTNSSSTADRVIIPFQASIYVDKKVNKSPIYFGLAASASEGAFSMYRYRGNVQFIPTDKRNFTSRRINIV